MFSKKQNQRKALLPLFGKIYFKRSLLLTFIGFSLFIACQPDTYRQGRVLYQTHCEPCHMKDGSGLGELIPSLKKSTSFIAQGDSLVCLIRKGIPMNPITRQQMPANPKLSDVDLTNLVNFLRSTYLPDTPVVQVQEVRDWIASCPTSSGSK